MSDDLAERFEAQRRPLERLAYRMLGVAAEAEDAVQDAFLRWHEALSKTTVADDGAYLRATVTRLCLDRLRSARARREVYVGPWLPEPLLGAADRPDDAAALADDVSFALLLALERLSPLERAAFLLHDVLDVPFDEIATTLGRTSEACRALASRAREHVRDAGARRLPRRADMLRVRDAFAAAIAADDPHRLAALLTHDVVMLSDGGGKKPAAINPIVGPDRVVRMLLGIAQKFGGLLDVRPAEINGAPGFVVFLDGELDQTVAFDFAGERIAALYLVRNPDKLSVVKRAFER